LASEKLVAWWNARVSEMADRIQAAPEGSKDTYFYWSQLVWQELEMWEMLGHRVDDDGFEFIANCRDFTPFQREFLEEGLTHLGLRR
jgi:hypothetical protein